MARRTIEERLSQLEAQKKNLQTHLVKQRRARDTRRKILLGAFILYRLEHDGDPMSNRLSDWLRSQLPEFLKRDEDKALFTELLEPSTTRGNNQQESEI